MGQRRIDLGNRAAPNLGPTASLAGQLELALEAFVVDGKALLRADDLLEIERKPVGIVELEGDAAGQRTGVCVHPPFVVVGNELKAAIERSTESLFLLLGDLLDEGSALDQLGVDIAHVVDDAKRAMVEKRFVNAEPMPMPNRATHDPAENVGTSVLIGEHAFGNQERGRARMVGDDAHADVVVGLARAVTLAGDVGG